MRVARTASRQCRCGAPLRWRVAAAVSIFSLRASKPTFGFLSGGHDRCRNDQEATVSVWQRDPTASLYFQYVSSVGVSTGHCGFGGGAGTERFTVGPQAPRSGRAQGQSHTRVCVGVAVGSDGALRLRWYGERCENPVRCCVGELTPLTLEPVQIRLGASLSRSVALLLHGIWP